MNLGRAVKLCRGQKGWTLSELSSRTGIALSHLSNIERGERDPSMTAVESIARAFGMPVNVLIFLASDPKDLAGMSDELREKLSRAALDLLNAATPGTLF